MSTHVFAEEYEKIRISDDIIVTVLSDNSVLVEECGEKTIISSLQMMDNTYVTARNLSTGETLFLSQNNKNPFIQLSDGSTDLLYMNNTVSNRGNIIDGGGGDFSTLYVYRALLNKNTCIAKGNVYGPPNGLNYMRAAKEIYAHAVCYYTSSGLSTIATQLYNYLNANSSLAPAIVKILECLSYLKAHANPITFGGDSDIIVTIFNTIWLIV